MNIPLIGFTGQAGAGKSTAAKAVVNNLKYTRVSFADPLRAMLAALGVTPEQMSVGKNEPLQWLGKTPRQLLQTLGTEWGRMMVHSEIWTRCAALRVVELQRQGVAGVVFDDVRFDNEALMIRDLGGFVFKIQRPGLPAMVHASEAGVSDDWIATTIYNIGEERTLELHAVGATLQHTEWRKSA